MHISVEDYCNNSSLLHNLEVRYWGDEALSLSCILSLPLSFKFNKCLSPIETNYWIWIVLGFLIWIRGVCGILLLKTLLNYWELLIFYRSTISNIDSTPFSDCIPSIKESEFYREESSLRLAQILYLNNHFLAIKYHEIRSWPKVCWYNYILILWVSYSW